MKIAVLLLSYERYDTLKQVLEHNLKNAGHPVDLFVWDNGSKDERIFPLLQEHVKGLHHMFRTDTNKGIAYPFNKMMAHCYERVYDAFHVMANDILEPDNWLEEKVCAMMGIPNSGMISISPGPMPYAPQWIEGWTVHPGDAIGQFMIS